jgi:hypothetical protein
MIKRVNLLILNEMLSMKSRKIIQIIELVKHFTPTSTALILLFVFRHSNFTYYTTNARILKMI